MQNKNKIKPHQNLLAAPIPTRTDPRYKAQTIGFRKDKIKTLQTEVQGIHKDVCVTDSKEKIMFSKP